MKKPWKMTRHQKGRELAIWHGHYASWNAPGWYRRFFTVHDRKFNKRELYLILNGKEDGCFKNNHRHCAAWYYW